MGDKKWTTNPDGHDILNTMISNHNTTNINSIPKLSFEIIEQDWM